MKSMVLGQKRRSNSSGSQQHIGPGIAVEDELGRIGIRFGDEGHRRARLGGQAHAPGFYVLSDERLDQRNGQTRHRRLCR